MDTKKCSKCKIEKPLKDFYKCNRDKLGVQSRCKLCIKLYKSVSRENKTLVGQKLGRLMIIEDSGERTNQRCVIYICLCDCGNYTNVSSSELKRKDGVGNRPGTRSCGCLMMDIVKDRNGDKNRNWNPNLTDEDRKYYRHTTKNKKWRKLVFERDNFICQCCFNDSDEIRAHHLDGWHWCIEKRYNIDNGITLCYDCHNNFHSICGVMYNTREQFMEFVK